MNTFFQNIFNFQSDQFSILSLLIKGGWIMIPIILLSLISVYIIIYKLIQIFKISKYSDQWIKNLRNNLLDGDTEKVLDLCKQRKNTIFSKVIKKCINRISIDKNLTQVDNMIEAIGKNEIYKLEDKISTLGVIAGAAPMLGFLGTVTGLIQAFIKISQSKTQINPSLISGGIYEAMITTAAGLFVGIIAYLGYNYLTIKIDKIANNLEYKLADFLDAFNVCVKKQNK